jgi:hypothetical protein
MRIEMRVVHANVVASDRDADGLAEELAASAGGLDQNALLPGWVFEFRSPGPKPSPTNPDGILLT